MRPSLLPLLPVAFGLLAASVSTAQFTLTYDGTVPVTRDGAQLKMPWAGGINFAQFSSIDLDQDGDLDLFAFDRSGNEVITLINDGGPGEVEYHYTQDYDNVYPFNELHDWALLRDYNCDGKPDIWSYSLGGSAVYKNTSDGGLSFELVDTLVHTNYQPTFANLYITQVDIPGIEDLDNDGDLDVLTFTIFGGNYLEYHRNLSMELYGTCDSLVFEIRNRCWGYFSENLNNNSVNLDDSCGFNVPNPEMPLLIEAYTEQLKKDLHDPKAQEEAKSRAHVGSTILPLDLDDDDVKDLILGDVLYKNLVALSNDGTVDNGHMVAQDSLYPVYDESCQLELFPAAYYVDLDNDQKRDLVVGANNTTLSQNYESVWHYRNDGTDAAPDFTFQKVDLFQEDMLEYGEGAYPVLFDHNGDGLMDLIVADYGYFITGGNYPCKLALLENTGSSDQPEFTQMTDDYEGVGGLGLGQGLYPAFGDVDNDGDKDMYVGDLQGRMHFFNNTPSGSVADLALTTANITDEGGTTIDVGQFAKPQFFDVNGDGKLDLLVGERNGNINYYRNSGTLSSPLWHLENDSLGGLDVAEWWNVTGHSVPFMFINSAGERELLVGSESGWIYDFGNIDGNLNGTFTLIDSTWQEVKDGGYSSVVLYDLNNDGYDEAVTGNYRGGITYYRNDFGIGIEEGGSLTSDQIFTLAPNPANASVDVLLHVPPGPDMELSLLDLSGRTVVRHALRDRQVHLDTRTLSDGVYIVRVGEQGRQWCQRLAVLHR